MAKHIFIITGEPSADMHGASLSRALKKLYPQLRISGIGSEKMRRAGVETFADLTQYAVIGFIEVIKHLSVFKSVFQTVLTHIARDKPQAVVLIDFPGFNLRLAKRIKKDFPSIKVIYYISPQVWAWGKNRIKLIKRIVDKMIVVFEFERRLYRQKGVDAEFVGHPLLELPMATEEKGRTPLPTGVSAQDHIISLLPGSRETEVKKILPLLLQAADLLSRENKRIGFILFKAQNIKGPLIGKLTQPYRHLPLYITEEEALRSLPLSSFAWVCSGTATLETAIAGVPMLIVYKTSFFTWIISRLLIGLPYIGLVNIVAGKKIIPEFIQYQATPRNIFKETMNFLNGKKEDRDSLKEKLRSVREKLGSSAASHNAAQLILKLID